MEAELADFDECLHHACLPAFVDPRHSSLAWPRLRKTGCDDSTIVEVLRSIWPQSPCYEAEVKTFPGRKGYTIRGGVTPAIWMGARKSKDQTPTLAGLELADRVRRVLELPRVPPVAPAPASTVKPGRSKK